MHRPVHVVSALYFLDELGIPFIQSLLNILVYQNKSFPSPLFLDHI
jgi:hypothetical protein